MINFLIIGDVVGKCGRELLFAELKNLKKEYNAFFTIVNGENAVTGNGITEKYAYMLLDAGADIITLGNHAFDKKEIGHMLDSTNKIIRPLNISPDLPGDGISIMEKDGVKIAVINLLGLVNINGVTDCPFITLKKAVDKLKDRAEIIIVDFHAEATSEKQALGYYMDGKITLLFGTHTHVQTNDARILANGTGYITDVGMTGPVESVIGLEKEIAINRFLGEEQKKFKWAEGEGMINGILVEIEETNFKVKKIHNIFKRYPNLIT